MKLLADVYQVGGPSLSHPFDATAYLLPCGDGLMMIDCGTPLGAPLILDKIRALGFDPKAITRIYATHGHYDHIAGAKQFKAPLYLHEKDRKMAEEGDSLKTSASLLYGQEMPPLEVAGTLQDGDIIHTLAGPLTVLHTPGHSPGSCCFLLSHRDGLNLLFAADTLHGGFSPLVGSDEAAWKASLDRLAELPIDCYTFGHCPPSLLFDAGRRIASLRQSFANYYNPWFKDFYRKYPY